MAHIIEERVSLKEEQPVPIEMEEQVPVEAPDETLERARIRRARERARAVAGFYTHVGVYLIVNLGIFLVNAILVVTNPGQNWFFYWVLLGWGIAVLIHGFTVFGTDRFFGPEWEERKIKEYLSRET